MVKLRGMDVILWREELKRKVGTPTKAPHLQGVSRYICDECKRVFYYRQGDPETPQYEEHKRLCHKCFHKLDCRTPLYHSGCWLCDLQNARKARANGIIRDTGSKSQAGTPKRDYTRSIEQISEESEQGGVSGGSILSSRRRVGNNKKNRRSRQ